jgi:hypothetical protein
MNRDSLMEFDLKVGPWLRLKPSGSKYVTFGGWGVLYAEWAFFSIRINYARKAKVEALNEED